MISIIVPVYNTSKYLEKCLSSILSQTYTDLEVLLIDDGSSDGSSDICDKFSKIDKRFRVWHRQNHGVSASRNFGLELCIGDWISFIDSDDWLAPDMMETMIDLSTRTMAGTVCCGVYQGDENKHEERNIWRCFSDTEHVYSENEVLGCIIGQSGTLWNKILNGDRARSLRFRENIRYAEDTLYLAEYLENEIRVAVTKKCKYYYRYNRIGNVVSSKINSRHLDYIESTILLYNILQKNGFTHIGLERAIDVIVRILSLINLSSITENQVYIDAISNIVEYIYPYKQYIFLQKRNMKQIIKYLMLYLAKKSTFLSIVLAKLYVVIK